MEFKGMDQVSLISLLLVYLYSNSSCFYFIHHDALHFNIHPNPHESTWEFTPSFQCLSNALSLQHFDLSVSVNVEIDAADPLAV